MSAVAVVEGTGWPPHEMAINSASTEFDLVAAFQNLHSELLSGACFANEQAVKQTCMAKYNNVGGSKGGVWTRSCAQWYLRCMVPWCQSARSRGSGGLEAPQGKFSDGGNKFTGCISNNIAFYITCIFVHRIWSE